MKNTKRKKRKKKSYKQQLQDQCLALFKEICLLRDGRFCMVKKHFPAIAVQHAGHIQVDHCVTRANKTYFTDPRNGTVVCGGCNNNKHYKSKSVDRAIDDIVRAREGQTFFDQMIADDKRKADDNKWSNVLWLETHIAGLKTTYRHLLDNR